jgi:glycosyltransferase involved in cell wall biosynthesis
MKVSCIIPFYNSEKYFEETIQSVLAQTFKDFELILVDDSSTDGSKAIADKYQKLDPRIVVTSNKYEKGISGARNSGLDIAKGEYIANLDSDDISLPTRFEKQVQFLDANPDIGVVGTEMQEFGSRDYHWPVHTVQAELKVYFLAYPTIWNPAGMYRKKIIDDFGIRYRSEFDFAEDGDFWLRLLGVTKFGNIDEVLVKYRIHGESVSISRLAQQKETWRKIISRLYKEIGIESLSDELFEVFYLYDMEEYEDKSREWKEKAFKDMDALLEANRESQAVDQATLEKLVADVKIKVSEYID